MGYFIFRGAEVGTKESRREESSDREKKGRMQKERERERGTVYGEVFETG